MHICTSAVLTVQQKESLLLLWNKEYPAQLAFPSPADLAQYLRTLACPLHYTISLPGLPLAAWACAFNRDGRRWFAIIVDSAVQQSGLGSALLRALKQANTDLNGWVVDHDKYLKADGTAYSTPAGFYTRNGFAFCTAERLETGKTSAVKVKWEAPPDL